MYAFDTKFRLIVLSVFEKFTSFSSLNLNSAVSCACHAQNINQQLQHAR